MFWFVVFVAGCVTARPVKPGDILEVDAKSTSTCKPLGTVEERIEAPSETEGLAQQANDAVRQRAAKLGATHMVVVKNESDMTYAELHVEAFRCK